MAKAPMTTTPVIPHYSVPPIPSGRPSQNLGNIFHSQLNINRTLPVNIFESNPIPSRTPLSGIVNAANHIPYRAKNTISFRQRFLSPLVSAIGISNNPGPKV